jgi:hypothetical protein
MSAPPRSSSAAALELPLEGPLPAVGERIRLHLEIYLGHQGAEARIAAGFVEGAGL